MLTLIRIINERASVLCPTEQQLAYAGELLAGPALARLRLGLRWPVRRRAVASSRSARAAARPAVRRRARWRVTLLNSVNLYTSVCIKVRPPVREQGHIITHRRVSAVVPGTDPTTPTCAHRSSCSACSVHARCCLGPHVRPRPPPRPALHRQAGREAEGLQAGSELLEGPGSRRGSARGHRSGRRS